MHLERENLHKLWAALAAEAQLLVPVNQDGVSKFAPYRPGLEADLRLVKTTLPPKDALFPQTQKIYRYRQDAAGQLEISELHEEAKQIIFGIRPCDVQSIACMDAVFLAETYVDAFYQSRRDQLLLIAIACENSEETCFCSSMGLSPAQAPGADWLLTPAAGGWNLTAQSRQGQALCARLRQAGLLGAGTAEALPLAELQLRVEIGGVAQKLPQLYEHPLWDQVYRPCLGCGACAYLCPTCYCYDINASQAGNQGLSFRCWDSCMFSEYSRMAGGHNPRPGKKERVRNRFLHKLAYFEERHGQPLCVGCGRCLEHCPAGTIDIIQVINLVKEAEVDA